LTPTDLEFCELCGSFIASLPGPDEHKESQPSKIYPEAPKATQPDSSPVHQHEEEIDPETVSEGAGTEVEKTSTVPPTKATEGGGKKEIPTWLLDIDDELKAGKQPDKSQDDLGGVEGAGLSSIHDDPVRRMDTSDLPIQPRDPTGSLDWLNALEGEEIDDDTEIPSTGEWDPAFKTGSLKPAQPGQDPEDADGEGRSEGLRDPGAIRSTRRRGTQPLDLEGKLLGVPQQLAGTNMPAWLNDQLQRPNDDGSDFVEDVELPEPSRATIARPAEPEIEPQEPDFEDSVLDPSFEKWLKELSDEATAPEWMDVDERGLEGALGRESSQVGIKQPSWLRETGSEESNSIELLGIEDTVEERGKLAGLRGAIQVMPLIAAPLATTPKTDYTISKEQQQQISILEGLVDAESVIEDSVAVQSQPSQSVRMRVVLGSALLILILVGLIVPSSTDLLSGAAVRPPNDAAEDMYLEINNSSGTPILVAFDYTPAMAGELDPIANALLEQMVENKSPVFTISQSAAGSEVAAIVSEQVNGLEWTQLGFLPGEAVGLRSFSECLRDSAQCDSIFGQDLSDEIQQSLAEVTLIVLLTSDRDSLVAWLEQVGTQIEDSGIVAGVTQALGPVIIPYLASGQLEGALDGYLALVAYERYLLSSDTQSNNNITGLTLALWFGVATLIAGTIYYAATGLGPLRRG
jgi:hypothetical protein